MPSLRAQLFNLYLKAVMKPKPLHLIDAMLLRARVDKMAPKRTPAGVTLEIVDADGVKGEWHRASDASDSVTILYMHGGGYFYCSPRSHRNLTFALARMAQAALFSLDYRMAPEHPFPAAVEDAVAAYEQLLAQGRRPETLILAGDSAGGGLGLALMLVCKERGLPLPAGAVLYSPWTDLAGTGGSLQENAASEVMFNEDDIVHGAERYLGDADPKNPLISPLYGDLSGLPPIRTFVSDAEVLLDDSTRLHERLLKAGVDSELNIEKGLAHDWPLFYPRFPEAGKTIAQSAAYISKLTRVRCER